MRRHTLSLVVLILFPLVVCSDSRFQGPLTILARADQLALLYNWPKAALRYAKAESLLAQSGDEKGAIAARLGYIWSTADSGVSATSNREVATYLESSVVQSDSALMLRALIARAALDHNTNEIAARSVWEEVLRVARKVGNTPWEARAKAEIGQIRYLDGDVNSAAVMMREAIVSQYLHLDLGAAVYYTAMVGNGFVEAGQPEAGLQYCNIALRAAYLVPDIGFPFLAYQGKARALIALERNAEAEQVLDEAMTRAREDHDYLALSQLLIVSGGAAASSDSEAGIRNLKEANEISEQQGFQHVYAWSAFQLAEAYRDTGDLDAAEALASRAIEIMRDLEDQYHLPQHLTLLAGLEAKKGDWQRADELYSEATDLIEALLVNVTRRQLKSSFIATLSDAYVEHFQLAATKLGSPKKAFEIIEAARGRAVADTLRGESESLSASTDEISQESQQEINRLQAALLRETKPERRQSLRDQLFIQEQLLWPVRHTKSPLSSAADRHKPVPLEMLQRSLRTDEMLLEYVLGEAESYCLRITRTAADIISISSGRKRIAGLVKEYLDAVRSRRPDRVTGNELYSRLLQPAIGPNSSGTRIIVVPDGPLHLLPFDGLEDLNGKYVLESHLVSYAPSATVLHLLRQSRSAVRAARDFLGVGGVLYPQASLSTSGTSGSAAHTEETFADLFDSEAVAFPDLPGSIQEVTDVNAVIKGSGQLLLGRNATEGAFKALPLSDFGVMHFAVHGVSSERFPDRAALVLGTSQESEDDGLLQVREIRDLPIHAELVTLSACDTGSGRLLGEEGIASLERAFLLAGAKSVIASLWTADDTFTIALMKRLYQHLVDGDDKDAALRKAKLDVLAQFGGQALPVYWAGFALVGDGSTPIFR